MNPGFEPIPILYFTQLMAIAFGLDAAACGFENNIIDPLPLFNSKVFT
jgi:heterodisulfide reductase subunit B